MKPAVLIGLGLLAGLVLVQSGIVPTAFVVTKGKRYRLVGSVNPPIPDDKIADFNQKIPSMPGFTSDAKLTSGSVMTMTFTADHDVQVKHGETLGILTDQGKLSTITIDQIDPL